MALALVRTTTASGLKAGVVALDAALNRGAVTCEQLNAAVARDCLNDRALRRVRTALGLVDERCESPGESLTRTVMHSLGILLRSQVEIRDARGFIGRVDFARWVREARGRVALRGR